MDIEALAQEAGFKLASGSYWTNVAGTDDNLQRFADAVATAERERLRIEIEGKLCKPMYPGGHSFNHGVEAALECLRSNGGGNGRAASRPSR